MRFNQVLREGTRPDVNSNKTKNRSGSASNYGNGVPNPKDDTKFNGTWYNEQYLKDELIEQFKIYNSNVNKSDRINFDNSMDIDELIDLAHANEITI